MPDIGPESARPQGESPGAAPSAEEVLGQALARLGRSVGFDAARALAYDPEVLIPVSFVASGLLLDWGHIVAACWNEQAELDVHKFADLARSRQHVAVMAEDSAEARQSPRWQNLIVPDGFRHELRAVGVDDRGHCWGSVVAFRDSRRPFTDKDRAAAGGSRWSAPTAARWPATRAPPPSITPCAGAGTRRGLCKTLLEKVEPDCSAE